MVCAPCRNTICVKTPMSTYVAVILRGWTASRFEGGESSVRSSQHLISLTRLAQLRLHKATQRGIFLNAKDAFPVTRNANGAMGMRVWEWSLFHRGNSGWIERRCVACVTLANSQSTGAGSGQRSREDTNPPLFVCIKPLSDTSFRRPASTDPSEWSLEGICQSTSVLHLYYSSAFTGWNGQLCNFMFYWCIHGDPHFLCRH